MGVPAAPQAASQASTTQQSQDPLLQLIEQAEQLKAALQQAGSRNGGSSSVQRPLLSVAAAAPGTATAPRLPNLLLPQADGSLSAATAALLAAAQALRIEGEQQQPKRVLIGHSMGGAAAAEGVISNPEGVAALVLVAPAVVALWLGPPEEAAGDAVATGALTSSSACSCLAACG